MTDLERILSMAVRMDAHDSRKARDIFDRRLRELAFDEACSNVYEGITKDTPSAGADAFRQATAHLPKPREIDEWDGPEWDRPRREGAVLRERARLDGEIDD